MKRPQSVKVNPPKKAKNTTKSSSKKRIKKNEDSLLDDFNFFNFNKTDKEKNKHEIDPEALLKQLKIEEEDTKILLNKLKERKKVSRDFMKEMEQEKMIKERYGVKKNLMEKKKIDEYIRMINVIEDPINQKRANKMQKRLYNNLEEYKNDKYHKKLNLQDKIYEENLKNIDNNKNKKEAENKYIIFQKEAKMKIKERQKMEEKRKKHLLKMQKDNEKYQLLVKNNFKKIDDKDIDKNKNLLFQEEKNIEGTNLSPDMMNKNEKEEHIHRYEKRSKSLVRNIIKSGVCQLPKVNENLNFGAHKELSEILRNEKDNLKRLEKLLIFKKKYKFFDISSYIQTGKMKDIHNAKIVRVKHEDICLLNYNPNFNLNFEIGKNKPEDIIVYRNYLQSCKYNNNEHIQAYLLQAKNDVEVWTMVNERDEYGRNGLMYLLIHNNINMIKLTLLSGVTLDDKTDIFGRNLIHYCCSNIVNNEMLDIICHCIDFKNFSDLCKYVDKCIPVDNNNMENEDVYTKEYQLACEKRIENFDNMIEKREQILIEKGIIIKEDEDDYYNYNYNKDPEKNLFIEVKREIKDPYENIHKKDIHIIQIVNAPDVQGDYPIHYLVKNNTKNKMKKIEILVYFHAKVDVLNSQKKKAIDLTNNKKIQQFLLKQMS